MPRYFHISHVFTEPLERIGNSIPVTLTVLGAGRLQNAVHAMQSIQKSQVRNQSEIPCEDIPP
eukprot:7530514-Karenia_brevis.AAC.1